MQSSPNRACTDGVLTVLGSSSDLLILEAGQAPRGRRQAAGGLLAGCRGERALPNRGWAGVGLGLGWAWLGWEACSLKMGVGKTWFCLEMVSKFEIMGFPATQMDCMVPRRPLGEPVSPQTPPENCFTRISPILGKLGKAPGLPLYIPYWPFVGL